LVSTASIIVINAIPTIHLIVPLASAIVVKHITPYPTAPVYPAKSNVRPVPINPTAHPVTSNTTDN
jgi:hypothetical protein